MRNFKRVLAVLLAVSMLLALAACGDKTTPTSKPTDTPATPTNAPATPTPTLAPLKIKVAAPSDNEHVSDGTNDNEMVYYQKLIDDINKYTNMDITYEWIASGPYYDDEHLGLSITTKNVADVLVVAKNETFLKAAEEGLFWDLAPYIDDYPNLATIPQATRENASYNGKLYGLPRSRTLARNGLGYRQDWLNNLGLAEPTTWEAFAAMLHAFTYDDPDKDNENNTVGLAIDQWDGVWNIMMTWFGVPNEWGLDKDGKLIYKYVTEEYKTALKAFRALYEDGCFNIGQNGVPAYSEVGPGKARDSLLRTGLCGCGVQVLDDQRKVETYFEQQDSVTVENEEDLKYTLQGYVDTGKGPLCYPTTGMNNMIAISTVNIKTEAQLRQVLNYLDKLNDGEMLNIIEYGWEGLTYKIEDGYVVLFSTEELEASGVGSTKYNYGFNQVIPYFTAEANARKVDREPANTAITKLENKLYADDVQYCVPNYGASYTAPKSVEVGTTLNSSMQEAQLKYITCQIDEAGLDEAIRAWKTGGGDEITKQMNELYKK